jgi:hypothetical protein
LAEAFCRKLQPDTASFDSLANTLAYLKGAGWRVTKSTIYRHHQEGKIRPRQDGAYLQVDVDKYARTWLKQTATGQRLNEHIEDLQRKKLERELQSLELEIERKRFTLERDQGRYLPRDQVEIELATRAGILDAGLKHWIQSRAAEWIRTVEGDMKRLADLINLLNRDLDEHINTYATTKEYRVIIEAGNETESEVDIQAHDEEEAPC